MFSRRPVRAPGEENVLSILQPNSRDCFVCGLENSFGLQLRFHMTGPGEVRTQARIPDRFQGYPGVVHGGVIAALLDEVVARAAMGNDPAQTRFMVTARLNLRFRRSVPVDQDLHVIGRVGRARRRTLVAHGSILDTEGVLLAEAEAVLAEMPTETQREFNPDKLGWRVYAPPDSGNLPDPI